MELEPWSGKIKAESFDSGTCLNEQKGTQEQWGEPKEKKKTHHREV